MIIDLIKHIENMDSMIGWFLMEASVGEDEHPVAKLSKAEDYDGHNVEMRLTLNGVEMNVERSFRLLGGQYNAAVEKRALELIEEYVNHKFSEELEDLQEATNTFISKIEEKLKVSHEEKRQRAEVTRSLEEYLTEHDDLSNPV